MHDLTSNATYYPISKATNAQIQKEISKVTFSSSTHFMAEEDFLYVHYYIAKEVLYVMNTLAIHTQSTAASNFLLMDIIITTTFASHVLNIVVAFYSFLDYCIGNPDLSILILIEKKACRCKVLILICHYF